MTEINRRRFLGGAAAMVPLGLLVARLEALEQDAERDPNLPDAMNFEWAVRSPDADRRGSGAATRWPTSL